MNTQTNRDFKIAVVGAGYMGQNHVKILSSLTDVNLVAVCDVDMEKTKKLSKQYKIKQYDNAYMLLETEKLDAISICLPTSLHYKFGIECIKRKIPTFMEKPVCETVMQAKKLTNLAKKFKTPIMVGHIERFNPVVNEIKLRVQAGELGKIIKIQTQRFSPPAATHLDVSVVVDLATHDIDVMKYILSVPIERLFAETENKIHKKEDFMSGILKFKNGVVGLIEVSWLHPSKIRSLTVLGDNGMYFANYLTQELFFYRQNKQLFEDNYYNFTNYTKADVVKIAFQSKEPLFIELKAFVDAVKKGLAMPVTANDGLYALEIAEKLIRSGQTNRVMYQT